MVGLEKKDQRRVGFLEFGIWSCWLYGGLFGRRKIDLFFEVV